MANSLNFKCRLNAKLIGVLSNWFMFTEKKVTCKLAPKWLEYLTTVVHIKNNTILGAKLCSLLEKDLLYRQGDLSKKVKVTFDRAVF